MTVTVITFSDLSSDISEKSRFSPARLGILEEDGSSDAMTVLWSPFFAQVTVRSRRGGSHMRNALIFSGEIRHDGIQRAVRKRKTGASFD